MALSVKPLVIPVFIPHSGCPHQCIFCNQRAISGRSAALPSENEIHSIINQYLAFKKDRPWVEVSFFGGNFLGLTPETVKHLLDGVMPFVKSKKINGIRFSTRPDTVDEERLSLIRLYPISTIELGVQSMNDQVLRQSGRGHTAEDSMRAVRLIAKEKLSIGLQMMTGLPGDDEALAMETARNIAALKPDFVRIYPTLVLAGSPLAHLFKTSAYQPQSLDSCVDLLKKLLLLFQKHRIPVIRMGLQASESLDEPSSVLAGPYHPALGHLVYSSLFLDTAAKQIRRKPGPHESIILTVHPKNLSRMQGLKKRNLEILKQRFNIRTLKIMTDTGLGRNDVVVE